MKLHAEELMQQLQAKMRERCPTVVWTLINERPDGVIYEWRIASCPPSPDQHELARIVEASMNLWRLACTAKGAELAPETRQTWLRWLNEARMTVR